MYDSYTVPGINFVGRQEQLVEHLLAVLRVLNVNFDEDRIRNLAPANVSRTPSREVVWHEALRRLAEHHERAALVRFGYATVPTDRDAGEGSGSGASREERAAPLPPFHAARRWPTAYAE